MRIPAGRYRIAGIRYWPEYWSCYSINDTCYLTVHKPITLMKRRIKTKMIGAHRGTKQKWLDVDAELASSTQLIPKLDKKLAAMKARNRNKR